MEHKEGGETETGHNTSRQPPLCTVEFAAILPLFAPEERDLIGLAAYALHVRARLAFESAFLARTGRAPVEAEMAAFLLSETLPGRIAAYRVEAEAMRPAGVRTEQPSGSERVAQKRWPFFGLWVDAPVTTGTDPERINWRGLFWRLAILLGAVMTTALLLRVLVVRA